MNILFYYPSNKRTIAMETLIAEFVKRGHKVTLLTLCEKGPLHYNLELMGVKTYSRPVKSRNFLSRLLNQILALRQITSLEKTDIVFSHLQEVNILAVFAQYVIRPGIIIFRHHDYAKNRKEAMADKIINLLARKVVVPSSGVKRQMLEKEKVNPDKVQVIPYVYYFSDYLKLNLGRATEIRKQYNTSLLLIMVSRLVPEKRHLLALSAVNKLIKEGKDIKMLLMDEGPERDHIEAFIEDNDLKNRVWMLGYQENITDFIQAADVLVHPSLSEASSSAPKEAALMEKIVIAVRGVGDFDDYIINGENGFLIDQEYNKAQEQLYLRIKEILNKKENFQDMGLKLKAAVLRKFEAGDEVMEMYEKLLK